MGLNLKARIGRRLARWLSSEPEQPADSVLLLNFERLCHEIRPADVILIEGRSKVSEVIKLITQSPWTHSALYIGRLYEIEDEQIREQVLQHYDAKPETQLIVEGLLGEGTVVYPLEKYHKAHIRLCRPTGLSPRDVQKVVSYAINRLGTDYNLRQLLDLARFMFPYIYLPRRWRSTLFSHNAGDATRTVCSTMIAQAFQSVKFPLLPFAERVEDDKVHFHQRNPKLVTPRDFDFSPYFDIIKYPLFGLDDIGIYRHLPWVDTEIVCNNIDDCFEQVPRQVEQATRKNKYRKTGTGINLLHPVKSIRGQTP